MKTEKSDSSTVRLDRWLWCIRVFKTRVLAKKHCDSGHVRVNGNKAKASQKLKEHFLIDVKKDGFWKSFKVLKLIKKRVGAPEAALCFVDKTDPVLLEKFQNLKKISGVFRAKGTGRPTKKERRDLDRTRRTLGEFQD